MESASIVQNEKATHFGRNGANIQTDRRLSLIGLLPPAIALSVAVIGGQFRR